MESVVDEAEIEDEGDRAVYALQFTLSSRKAYGDAETLNASILH